MKVPGELLLYLPLWTETDKESIQNAPVFSSREGFIFIGNGKHMPNVDAIRYLRETLWPLIRRRMPAARVDVYGAYLPEKIKSLHTPNIGFHIQGYTEDAHRVMKKARINLAPLRYGAGLKGKLLLALESGTPSITTEVGAEGLLEHPIAAEFIFDQPDAFAREAVRLYQDKKEWMRLQSIGYEVLEARFHAGHHIKKLSSAIGQLIKQLEEHRSRNFIGGMLHHHSLQSTKYMSRWINCKNKLKALQQGH